MLWYILKLDDFGRNDCLELVNGLRIASQITLSPLESNLGMWVVSQCQLLLILDVQGLFDYIPGDMNGQSAIFFELISFYMKTNSKDPSNCTTK